MVSDQLQASPPFHTTIGSGSMIVSRHRDVPKSLNLFAASMPTAGHLQAFSFSPA
jgi:hypothetical protein